MDIARVRLVSGRLVGRRLQDPAAVVQWLGAVQAQDYYGAKWALSLRSGAGAAEIDSGFDRGDFVRTHVLRPTWHFVAPEDLRWLLALTAPRVHKTSSHRYRQLELDERSRRLSDEIIAEALIGKELTRGELAEELEARGLNVDGQRLPYLLMHAELQGIICSGARRGKQQTYALLESRIERDRALTGDEALAELTRRYVTSHGPVTAYDFAWWSGLTVTEARHGLALSAPELEVETLDGMEYWLDAAARSEVAAESDDNLVHLLPNFDEQFVAYRDHGPSIDPRAPAILGEYNRRTLGPHLVSVNGLIVGGWGRKVRTGRVEVRVDLRVELTEAQLAALEESTRAYGRYLGLTPQLTVHSP